MTSAAAMSTLFLFCAQLEQGQPPPSLGPLVPPPTMLGGITRHEIPEHLTVSEKNSKQLASNVRQCMEDKGLLNSDLPEELQGYTSQTRKSIVSGDSKEAMYVLYNVLAFCDKRMMFADRVLHHAREQVVLEKKRYNPPEGGEAAKKFSRAKHLYNSRQRVEAAMDQAGKDAYLCSAFQLNTFNKDQIETIARLYGNKRYAEAGYLLDELSARIAGACAR